MNLWERDELRQSKPCPACAVKDAALAEESTFLRAAEARATAAERERDGLHRTLALREAEIGNLRRQAVTDYERLAAAEQREAEKDKAFRYFLSMAQIHSDITAGSIGRKAVADARAALASPSTPSPAPSAEEPTGVRATAKFHSSPDDLLDEIEDARGPLADPDRG
jgi:hypothetical protein